MGMHALIWTPKLLTEHAQRHAGKCEQEVGNRRTWGVKRMLVKIKLKLKM